MAAKIAFLLQGKDKPNFAPNKAGECLIIVTNCDKLNVTGRKKDDKMYHSFSGYPGFSLFLFPAKFSACFEMLHKICINALRFQCQTEISNCLFYFLNTLFSHPLNIHQFFLSQGDKILDRLDMALLEYVHCSG